MLVWCKGLHEKIIYLYACLPSPLTYMCHACVCWPMANDGLPCMCVL